MVSETEPETWSQDDARAAEARMLALLWLAVALVLCLPIWLPHLPPLAAFHDALARLDILARHRDVPALGDAYRVDWAPYPDLALVLLGLPLVGWLSVATAGKVFLTLTVLLWHAGTTWLSRAVCGRVTWRALIASFFVYSPIVFHGQVDVAFSLALCLSALALWIASRDRLGLFRLGAVTTLSLAVYFAQLFGFAVFAGAVVAMVLSRLIVKRNLQSAILGLLPVVPGILLFAITIVGAGRYVGVRDGLVSPGEAARDLLCVFTGYSEIVDLASLGGAILLVIVLGGVLLSPASAGQRFGLRRDLLVAALVLGLGYWFIPAGTAGDEGHLAFALGAFTLAFFAVEIRLPDRVATAMFLAGLLLFAIRTGTMAGYWMMLDRDGEAHRAALAVLSPGDSLAELDYYDDGGVLAAPRERTLALAGLARLVAVSRAARVVIANDAPGWQLVTLRAPLPAPPPAPRASPPAIDWKAITAAYDYLWVCHAPDAIAAELASQGTPVAVTPGCVLHRLRPAPSPAAPPTRPE